METSENIHATIQVYNISSTDYHNDTPPPPPPPPPPKLPTTHQIISDDVTHLVSTILQFGVSPAIAIIGITFNIFSIIVLLKHGLHKSSNILFLSLAFMDIGFLVGYNSIPNLLYIFHGDNSFIYFESVSLLLYILYFVLIVMDYALAFSALCIPMLITFERLVAVFMPLKIGQIVTPFRTWAAVIGITVFWIGAMAYMCFWYKFEYVFDPARNRSVGKISKSELFYEDFEAVPVFEEIFFSMKIPPVITLVGCVAIVVKIKLTSLKRSKMTSSKKVSSTSKTTKTLLAVCFAYLCTCAIIAVPSYLPEHMSAYSLTTNNPTNMAAVIYLIMNILYSFNSSWNFIVYVAFNKNFRDTFKEIMSCSGKKTSRLKGISSHH